LTVVWCTGFQTSYTFLDVYIREAVLNDAGLPIHERGVVSASPGLYFVGLRFQHTFVSQDIYGVGQDAEYIAEQIAARATSSSPCARSGTHSTLHA
jgi:putative flavoprotein involved in K+ transport